MSSKKATSPPPPHHTFSPPPYDIVQPLTEVKEDTVVNVNLNPNIDETKQEETFIKKKLLYHLQTRPERQKLVNLNILRAFDQDASLRAVMDNLMKQRLRMLLSSRILDKKLSNRKSIQSLIRDGILKDADETGSDDEEAEQKGNRRDMYRRMSNHSLTEFLSRRPTLQELVKANMVQDVMTWTKIACSGTIPRARNCHQMCLNADDEVLYLVGGFNTGSVSIDLLKFDIQNSVWSRPLVGGPVPPERYCHTVVNIDSNLVVFGGFSVEGKWLNDLHALDTEYAMNSEFKAFVPRLSAYGQCKASTNNSQMLLWYQPEATGDPPSPRAAHAACVVGKNMYIFGGNNYNKLFNDLHCLDTSNMKWSQVITQGKAPSPRANHSLTTVGDKYLIVFGGNDGEPLNDIHIFDIDNNTWTQPKMHGTPPIARGGHSAVCVKHKQLLIFAGGYNNKILNDLYILDVETMTWIRPSDTGMLPEPRAGHSCCVTKNNVVYICGGGDSENDKLFNDLYQLDTGYFTTDEKQISKLIYNKPKDKKSVKKESSFKIHIPIPQQQHPMQQYSMSRSSYEYDNGNFSQSNFNHHVQNFIASNDEQYGCGASNDNSGMGVSPLMQAGVISDDITNVSQEIDCIIQSVENGIKNKINEFRQKEQGYIMILRSIEAERTKLIDDVNRDITMLKFSVKESFDKLQQRFIAKMLKKHVDYVNSSAGSGRQQQFHHSSIQRINKKQPKKSKSKQKITLVRSPLRTPPLGIIQEEPVHKNKDEKVQNKINHDEEPANNTQSPQLLSKDETITKDLVAVQNPQNNQPITPDTKQSPPLPLTNSQSPNPTTNSALQQHQMGLVKPSKTMINAALTQQAEFQKHQMMARHFVKVQEFQRQQKLQQFQTQQLKNMQNILTIQQQQQHQPAQPSRPHNWWQRGQQTAYSLSGYGFNQQNGVVPSPGPVPVSAKKGKKKKKKRRKKRKKSNQGQNVTNISSMMNNNNMPVFNNNNNIQYAPYQAQFSPQSNPNTISSLNPNAMSFK